MKFPLAFALVLAVLPAPALAQKQPLAVIVASLDTGETVHAPGLIVLHNGRILALGAPDKVAVPEGAMRVPLARFHVRPGFVDANSQRGADGPLAETAFRLTPGFSAADAFDPFATGFQEAAAAGVTHRIFAPDGAAVLAGKAILLTAGDRHEGATLRREVALWGSLAPDAYRGQHEPSSRSEAIRAVVELFRKARAGELKAGDGYRTWRPDAAALQAVLERRLPLALRVASAADALAALALFRELGARGVLVGGNDELDQVTSEIKAGGTAVVLDPLTLADPARVLALPAKLAAAGIPFAFSSRAPRTLESGLADQAALAIRAGLEPEAAWHALTRTPVRIFDLPGGRLAAGGEATFQVLAGDPQEMPEPLQTVVGGKLDPRRLFQAMMGGGRQ